MQVTDLQVIKDIPGYKVILKAVLKAQIQQLVEQLVDHTGEESVILTASVSDGSLSHLGSESGKVFLEEHDDIKSQFLGFCLKRHHRQKQLEKEKQQQQLQDPGGSVLMAPTTPPGFGPGPRPRFAPSRVHAAQRHFSPRGVHPVSMTHTSHQNVPRGVSPNVRHEPYPGARPRRPDPQRRLSQPSSSMKLPTEPNEVIKIEAMDDEEENVEKSRIEERSSSIDSGQEESGSSAPGAEPSMGSPSQTTIPPTETTRSPVQRDDGSESSSSTHPNEPAEVKFSDTLPPGGLGLDSDLSNLSGVSSDNARIDTASSESATLDPNVNVKVEAVADSEFDLEITGVEPGQMAQPDFSMMPNLQMGYGPSTSGAQGDQSSQGYRGLPLAEISSQTTYSVWWKAMMSHQIPSDGLENILPSNFSQYAAKNLTSALAGQKNSEAIVNVQRSDSGVYICDKCGKAFSRRLFLQNHQRIHTGSQPYRCHLCPKKFNVKGNLTAHIGRHHTNPEWFKTKAYLSKLSPS